MPRATSNSLRETGLPLVLLTGDTLVTFAGLSLGYWLRYASPVGRFGLAVPDATFARYLPLLLLGVALLVGGFAQLGLYDSRLLLRRYQSLNLILKGAAFWGAIYLGVSLVVKFEPPISRLFVVLAFGCVVGLLYGWRGLAYAAIARTSLRVHVQRRAAVLGWGDATRTLAAELGRDPAHPFAFAGVITLPGDPVPASGQGQLMDDTSGRAVRWLGGAGSDLDALLLREQIDLLIATRLDLPRDELRGIVRSCERAYVEWKVVPSAFDVFVSGLRLQTVGRLPVLGIEELAITRLFNRTLKRLIDIVGALVGLILSAPVVLVLVALIRRESPAGAVLFCQTRIGAGHRPFTLFKLRSMTPGAAASDDAQQSTRRNDPRLLRLGAWLRRWNLDELPQFWNVLRGDMSLVGPRPERPHHVEHLSAVLPHYLPRHLVKPGMTGWAQVNGLRGDSDLAARVQYDIYYIENWSLWLDVQILLLTFVRWRSPAE